MATNKLSPRVRSSNETSLFGLDVSQGVVSVAKQAKKYIGKISKPDERRRANAGLNKGGEKPAKQASTARFANEDWRVRLSMPDNGLLYHDNSNTVLQPLDDTNGVIFPYTPQILLQHSANYTGANPTHSNYTQHFYSNSSIDAISIQGDFTAQNQREAAYVVAAMTFLRSVTKMFWGKDQLAGTPPPVLRLNGYGDHIFNNIPVVVSNFTVDLSADVDYINTFVDSSTPTGQTRNNRKDGTGAEIPVYNTVNYATRVPTRTSINITVNPLYSRKRMKDFGLNDFAAGRLIKKDSDIGGFM